METEAYKLLMETVAYYPFFFFFFEKELFQSGWGVFVILEENSRGVGGLGHQFPAKMENPGRWGGPK